MTWSCSQSLRLYRDLCVICVCVWSCMRGSRSNKGHLGSEPCQQLQKYCLSFLDEAGPLEGFCVVAHRNVSLCFLTSLYHWVYYYYCGCLRFQGLTLLKKTLSKQKHLSIYFYWVIFSALLLHYFLFIHFHYSQLQTWSHSYPCHVCSLWCYFIACIWGFYSDCQHDK